jgi:hypothetical protein
MPPAVKQAHLFQIKNCTMKTFSAKHFFVSIAFLLCMHRMEATVGTNAICETPDFFCHDSTFVYDHTTAGPCDHVPLVLFYYFEVYSTVTSIDVSCAGAMTAFSLYGPYTYDFDVKCAGYSTPGDIIDSYSGVAVTTFSMNDGTHLLPGFYYLKITMASCASSVSFAVVGGSLRCEQVPCENCIGSFAPEPGNYIISLWVREEGAAVTKTSFDHPEVNISFTGSATTYGPFTASGQIIDGWQRIEGTFSVPIGATSILLSLECTTGNCLFDDIRVHPYDGSMKTYVYDPVSLKLVAELDERNYATIYEYDEEGKLLRIKKETERGIMTIQESKSSINKH